MPWQQLVADTALELRSDGLPAYRHVIVTVPRQNGKTTLLLSVEIDRALMWGDAKRVTYSAQDGQAAREKLLQDQWPILERSPLNLTVKQVLQTNGAESVLFKNGSRISTVASRESSGHGKTIALGVVDEAFNDVDNRREQALMPAMRTVRDAQLWICSTMGTDASLYLNQQIDNGRQATILDLDDARLCYFEWSAPDDCDIADPAVWAACNPAWGITIFEEIVRAEYQANLATPGEFRRFALNQRTASDERVIPLDAWEAVQSVDARPDGMVTFAVDCNPERSSSSIAVSDGMNVELVDHEHGTGWLVPRAEELSRKWSASVAVDQSGPAGAFIPELEAKGINVVRLAAGDVVKACGHFYDSVLERRVRIRPNGSLDASVAAANRRHSGDAWVWARKSSSVDISPLVTATLALWASQSGGPAQFF